jgi:acyl-CoA thioesterase-1
MEPVLVEPFWTSAVMHRESLFFLAKDGFAAASLLFPPDRVLAVTSATGEITFEAGRDYVIRGGRVSLPGASRIPAARPEDIAAIDADGDDGFHRRQAAITYEHQPALWRGYQPVVASLHLPRTLERLRARQTLAMAVAGDINSEGYNASGFVGVAPHQPPYATLVASALERAYGAAISLHNTAVAGWTADNGIHDVDRIVRAAPDLVVVAYGMNDAGYSEPREFAANIEHILADVRRGRPAAEFVLVAPMLPNPDTADAPIGRFAQYRNELARLCGRGVALADMTAMWTGITAAKAWYDLAGNAVNHPNDFGHRLYAQVILALLGAHGCKLPAGIQGEQ